MKLRNLLALALGLLLALTPLSAALAEGEDTTEPVIIGIDERTPAEQRTKERDVGDITLTCGGIAAAQVIVEAEGQGTIRAEDVTIVGLEGCCAIGAQVSATVPKAQATVKAGDALLKFYDCGTFEIIVNGQGTVGFYAFEDGRLTLRCAAPVSLTTNADGSATLTLGELSFPVDAAILANLK